MTTFNYRWMLKQYIAHIGEIESVTYLSMYHQQRLIERFTLDEIGELRRLELEEFFERTS